MHSVPIQCGAIRPQGRPRHALLPALLRLAAIAGLAFAGWIALSALSGAAEAAEPPARQAAVRADDAGYATVRHVTSRPGWRAMAEDVREAGDHPMRYVGARRHDLFDDKDKVVRQVRELADEAGVPRLRVPDMRQRRPVKEFVHRVTDRRPAPRPAADEPVRSVAQPDGRTASPHAAARKAAPRTAGYTAAPGASSYRAADGCMGCRTDQEAPAHAPVAPAPDAPSGGGSTSGHPLIPVADLPNRRTPAAPPAVDASTFHRTALTDVAAPGGPSVVPD
ncbi:hypothetical protein [Actinomadura geliboluensis]|jgi:hypothetical protein|uniref:Uncharacterized protein n=1 Tax=Actinomadura geliboluensis TaxID=882440 RepID=A0A5S4G0L3_9ACTN|nr:hypothetical protein [Actinomadura geliboluensis]TMR26044.1 hypothetical protein ETD96_41930 [Actinomadura geliboluensis]